ncbi:hypothetical protein GOBAR_AA28143 [Gossypium barbadense]|uniref:Uncharacterized protein n=1 Tax=Gossypium barbadense TaxID=3634 RepID=A0A2P5WN63_GOSBA|nr:hypothetical protein GOBAR_AA28143 [Gossypium barbadense]
MIIDVGTGELTLRVGDERITLQARNSGATSEIESDRLNHSTKTNNMVQPTLQEMSLKEAYESFSSNSRGSIHEDRSLQIEELDEWRTHKSRTRDKPKLRQKELNTFPRQLKARDKVLLDAANPHIVTTTPNEEISLTVLSIFPFGTVEVRMRSINSSDHYDHSMERHRLSSSRGKKAVVPASKKKKGASSSLGPTAEARHPLLRLPIGPQEELFQILRSRPLIADTLVPGAATYNPSRSKASALPLSLRYLYAILAHTIIGRRESTGVVNTHDAYFLWLLSTATQESSLTLIGQMSPQGISSMLSMGMIKECRGTYPPQYRLAQSTKEEAPEDITDDVPPQHEDPPSQPPPPFRLVHATASYADISERLTRFEQ